MTQTSVNGSGFVKLLREQVGHEFAAQQQYIALAVWFDAHDLPQLSAHFYRQAVEERNHAMMMVQYMLDRDLQIEIPSVSPVRNDFADVREPLRLALEQEKEVTAQIERLFKAARDDGDFLGEQFVLWFLKEKVEEVSAMSTLVAVAERAGDTGLFQIEDFIAREQVGDSGASLGAPRAAGGAL